MASQSSEPVFANEGDRVCCDQRVTFAAETDWFRDTYRCASCGSIPRERALMHVVETTFPGWRELEIHESSPGARGASVKLRAQCPLYVVTHYVPGVELGAPQDGFRNENLEALTFEDESFDLHITQDVLEHVLDPQAAFREIARTLKPGGAHVFTTPLVNGPRPSEVCARMGTDGTVAYLREPEYHASTVSQDGALVTMHWGYDITRHIFQACGLFTTVWRIDSLELGIRAELIEVLVAARPGNG